MAERDNRRRQRPIEILTENDVELLMLAAADPDGRPSPTGLRNRALVAVLFKSGLRLSEVLALAPRDVQQHEGGVVFLNVRDGKGSKQRHARLFNGAADELHAWMQTRAAFDLPADAPVFCAISKGREGKALVQPYIAAMMQRLAARAGVTKRVHPHGFRHSHASLLFHRGLAVAAIQAQLGHEDPMTTQVYLASIGAGDAQKALAAFDWNG